MVINVKKPKNLVATIEVKLLETDVLNSPKVFNFLCSSNDISTVQDLTRLEMTGTGLPCKADLETSEVEEKSLVGCADAVENTLGTSASPSDAVSSHGYPPQPTYSTVPKLRTGYSFHESNYLAYFSPLDSTNPEFLINVDK